LSAAAYARPPGLPQLLGATNGAESVAGAQVREHELPTNSMPVVAPDVPAREAAVAVAAVAGQVVPAAGGNSQKSALWSFYMVDLVTG